MRIGNLRTNHMENPLGYLMDHISLSWVVKEAKGERTERSRVEISKNKEFTDIVYDSKESPANKCQ